MKLSRQDMISLLMSEEEIACELQDKRPPHPLERSPSLSRSPKSPHSKRHTVNFHVSTINHEMKSKKTPEETELAAVSVCYILSLFFFVYIYKIYILLLTPACNDRHCLSPF